MAFCALSGNAVAPYWGNVHHHPTCSKSTLPLLWDIEYMQYRSSLQICTGDWEWSHPFSTWFEPPIMELL